MWKKMLAVGVVLGALVAVTGCDRGRDTKAAASKRAAKQTQRSTQTSTTAGAKEAPTHHD